MIDEEIRTILREELEALKERIDQNMTRAGQHATGKTRRSMEVKVQGLAGVLTGRQAFASLETGSRPWSRRPKYVPRFFADIIGEWIEAKSLDLNKWAVARTLIDEGSVLRRSGGRSDIYSPEIQKTMDRIADRVAEQYEVLITNRLFINPTTL